MITDPQLIFHAKHGDSNAISKLHMENYKPIMRHLLTKYRGAITQQDAEDAYQEAFRKFIENPHSITASTDIAFSSWLKKVSENGVLDMLKSADYRRKAYLPEDTDFDQFSSSDDSVEQQVLLKELLRSLDDAIKQLNEVDREIILRFMRGEPQKDIANKIGISYESLRQRKSRIISKLHKVLGS